MIRYRLNRGGDPHADSWFSFSRVLSLPTRYHAYALDQRGHGDSERPACRYGIDDFAADIVAFLDGVGIGRDPGRALGQRLHRPPGGGNPPRPRGSAGAHQRG